MIGVVGGSGFIGTRLVGRLVRSGVPVRIVDIARSSAFPDLVRTADVRDARGLTEALRGCQSICNLAAAHRDDVKPISLYRETNVDGARNTCAAAQELRADKIVFTSSASVYGSTEGVADEEAPCHPISEYGRTKLLAESVYHEWAQSDPSRSLVIVRPTVVFGEGNRGNVYNLLRQIASRRFVMVGNGENRKSMAYVENVAAFLEHCLTTASGPGLYNYADKPDFSMNELVQEVRRQLGTSDRPLARMPYAVGYAGGVLLDALSALVGKPFPISAVRVAKFCANTVFSAQRARSTGFEPPHELWVALRRTLEHEFPRRSGS